MGHTRRRCLGGAPRLAAVVVSVALAVAATSGAGCGKSKSMSQSATTSISRAPTTTATTATNATTATTATEPLPTPGPLRTRAQAVVAGDTICATIAKQARPLTDRLAAIQKSNASRRTIYLESGPVAERIAGATRNAARQLMEMHLPSSDKHLLKDATLAMLETAVVEEGLAQAYRGDQPSRVNLIKSEVVKLLKFTSEHARVFGFKVCSADSQPSAALPSRARTSSTRAAESPPTPTLPISLIQAVAKGDSLCAENAKRFKPLTDHFDEIQKSSLSRQEVNLKSGPVLERIASATRSTARQLSEMSLPADDERHLKRLVGTLFELAVIEEQLSQAYRNNELPRIGIVKREVVPLRLRARRQARDFGFKVCGAGRRPPVA
jgi:hypothetical protein